MTNSLIIALISLVLVDSLEGCATTTPPTTLQACNANCPLLTITPTIDISGDTGEIDVIEGFVEGTATPCDNSNGGDVITSQVAFIRCTTPPLTIGPPPMGPSDDLNIVTSAGEQLNQYFQDNQAVEVVCNAGGWAYNGDMILDLGCR